MGIFSFMSKSTDSSQFISTVEEFKKEGVIVEIAPVLKLYRNLLKPKNAIRFLFEIRESIKVADRLNEKYNFDIIYSNISECF